MKQKTKSIKKTPDNIVLAIVGLNGFVSTEVKNSTSVLRLRFSAKNPAHRQYVARCATFKKNKIPLKSTETKYENNWQEKTLENLEKDFWGLPDYDSHLVRTCHQLRKKPLKDFEIEDLRIMIGQNIGLKFLIPLALEKMKNNIFAEGDYYKGDLLKSVLTSEVSFWVNRVDLLDELDKVIQQNMELLDENNPELTKKFNRLKSSVR